MIVGLMGINFVFNFDAFVNKETFVKVGFSSSKNSTFYVKFLIVSS